MRAFRMIALPAAMILLSPGLALSDAGLDPNSPEGKQKIEEYKDIYVDTAACADRAVQELESRN
jgi:hypothetical protein